MIGTLLALGLLVVSGLACLASRRDRAPIVAVVGALAAAACALPDAIAALVSGTTAAITISWAPPIETLRLGLDPLSAFFMIPIVVVGAVCASYGASYLERGRRAATAACLFNLLVAAMLLVVVARDAIGFLMAWELMTLASYLLVIFDHAQPEVRRAGWVYLIASHLGVACVVSAFVLLGDSGLSFESLGATGGTATAAGILAIAGFGVKAGIVPLHVWLPEAHAAAPSHVSAVMSAVMIKLGLYGILRTITFIGPALPWGSLLLGIGVVGGIVGISLALYQRDLKRALAYSSIENIGIVLIGIGLAMWASSAGHDTIAALAWCGGLFHIWNHAIMKSHMFLAAGSIVHATGTRDLEQLGGLGKQMPRTSALVILGSLAIAGLPPLAGFASEWLIYMGLARGGMVDGPGSGLLFLFVIAAMATIGVMAALCFVRIVGLGVLGQPRSPAARNAHESSRGLLAPIAVLATASIAIAAVLPVVVRCIEPVVAGVTGRPIDASTASDALMPLVVVVAVMWAVFAAAMIVARRVARRRRETETWGCGYTAPTPRMQYSAASFSEGIHRLLPRGLRARVAIPHDTALFPSAGQTTADRADPFTRAAYEPLLDRGARRFGQLRWVQRGLLHLYILYVVLAVVVVLAIVSIRDYVVLP